MDNGQCGAENGLLSLALDLWSGRGEEETSDWAIDNCWWISVKGRRIPGYVVGFDGK